MTEDEKRACDNHVQKLLDYVSKNCNSDEMREVRNKLQAILLTHFNYS